MDDESLCCPITGERFVDPVMDPEGNKIELWGEEHWNERRDSWHDAGGEGEGSDALLGLSL